MHTVDLSISQQLVRVLRARETLELDRALEFGSLAVGGAPEAKLPPLALVVPQLAPTVPTQRHRYDQRHRRVEPPQCRAHHRARPHAKRERRTAQRAHSVLSQRLGFSSSANVQLEPAERAEGHGARHRHRAQQRGVAHLLASCEVECRIDGCHRAEQHEGERDGRCSSPLTPGEFLLWQEQRTTTPPAPEADGRRERVDHTLKREAEHCRRAGHAASYKPEQCRGERDNQRNPADEIRLARAGIPQGEPAVRGGRRHRRTSVMARADSDVLP
mmetsp:Transcript_2506/g.4864  ORF Transcript_2506/g.4864 Transcript_2506/m.4864 type:complete len:273 (-) Transcript_2506:27-845(-)|eukprot:CAMPEP_0119056474 /NCGR_PEP_ID=MMETSP1178-20130426/1120_2 /TAXON_ID=33656 /ORGANISM="unid sp, Strain CCMP2000" /LENGTH=272 /DNA_ID=CAMNT_0007037203 /DNA_START=55 /DNA_END=873 /DNA_ORIENTATION=-